MPLYLAFAFGMTHTMKSYCCQQTIVARDCHRYTKFQMLSCLVYGQQPDLTGTIRLPLQLPKGRLHCLPLKTVRVPHSIAHVEDASAACSKVELRLHFD
jgi:hypothetical protein